MNNRRVSFRRFSVVALIVSLSVVTLQAMPSSWITAGPLLALFQAGFRADDHKESKQPEVFANGPEAVALAYVDDDWAAFVAGTAIADADPVTAGNQPATFGTDAFGTIQNGVNAALAGGTVKVNSHGPNASPAGFYPESVSITQDVTLDGNPISGLASDVVINPAAGNGITVSGATADDVTIRDLRVSGAADGISADSLINFTITNVQASANTDDGIDLNGTGAVTATNVTAGGNGSDGLEVGFSSSITITGGTFNSNNDDGLEAFNIAGQISISNASFNDNDADNSPGSAGGDGIGLDTVGAVTLTNVTANGNDPGVFVTGAQAFADIDGTYSNNDDHGIQLIDIATSVTLLRTTADNNDADNDGIGDGVNSTDGGDPDPNSINGLLLVLGTRFRDTGGAADHQERGVFVQNIAGAATFQDSAGVVQSNIVTGNENKGVFIQDGGLAATFTNGSYSNNGDNGIDVGSLSGALTTNGITVSNNGSIGDRAGVFAHLVGSFSDSGSTFQNNTRGGMWIEDIAGGVTLVGTVAENNDFDNNNLGDGVTINSFTLPQAIGGNLLVQGGLYRDTGGPADHQERGIFVNSVVGSVTFEDSGGSVMVTGNETDGVVIADGGTTATFTNGTYSNNGEFALQEGIDLTSFSGLVSFNGVTADSNHSSGIRIDNAGSVSATGGGASNNGFHGLQANTTGIVNFDGGTYNSNGVFFVGGDGIALTSTGGAALASVTASGNHTGVSVATATAFSDTDGVYSNNDDHGIKLVDIGTSVALFRTTADNNDANNDNVGDGLNSTDGGDADPHSINGLLFVLGARLRDTGGPTDHQERGIFVANVLGNAVFQDSGGSVTVTGNEADGVLIADGPAATTTVTNGNYSNNGDDGIDLNSAGAVTMTGVTASDNINDGVEVGFSTSLTINGGTFNSNDDDGIDAFALSGAVNITGGTMNDNGGDGIDVEGGTILTLAVGTGNTANGNDENGLLANGFSDPSTITGWTFSGNGRGILYGGNSSLTVNSTTVTANFAQVGDGGGIQVTGGALNLNASVVGGNQAADNGGGIAILGGAAHSISNSTIVANVANSNADPTGDGGGVYASDSFIGTLTVTGTTIGSGNTALNGGGAAISGGTFNLNKSTISGNTANFNGGGIYVDSINVTLLTSVTITNNSAAMGGGVLSAPIAPRDARSSIIAGNNAPSAPDAAGISSSGYNLIGNGDGSGFTNGLNNDQVGSTATPIDPQLGPLANNGGPTFTHRPANLFPGHDKGCAFGAATDQRGMQRTVDWPVANAVCTNPAENGTDIGAFEILIPTAVAVSVSGKVTDQNGRGLGGVHMVLSDAEGNTLTATTNRVGSYQFESVPSGDTYVLTAANRRFRFTPRVLMVVDNMEGVDFVAEPR